MFGDSNFRIVPGMWCNMYFWNSGLVIYNFGACLKLFEAGIVSKFAPCTWARTSVQKWHRSWRYKQAGRKTRNCQVWFFSDSHNKLLVHQTNGYHLQDLEPKPNQKPAQQFQKTDLLGVARFRYQITWSLETFHFCGISVESWFLWININTLWVFGDLGSDHL